MGDVRALTSGEIEMLSTVYGDSLDYSSVRVRDGGTRDGSGFTPFNTINVGRNLYRGDFSQSNSLNLQGFFVHESAHALQTQNGRTAFFNGIGPQISAVLGGRREVYDYNDKLNGNVPFDDWNIEEQAAFFEDLYRQQVATANGTPLAFDPYHSRVIPNLEPLQAVDTSVYIEQVAVTGSVLAPDTSLRPVARPTDHCFTAETPIQMWPLNPAIKPRMDGSYDEELVLSQVWEKPISEIKVGDLVVAYDERGRLAPKAVTCTMTNTATHLLDFWGTGVTPGHAYYCADGKFKGQHVPLMDILRTDGAIMRADGTLIRAATNYEVGSIGDKMIHASSTVQKPDGSWTEQKTGNVRFGTRIILPDGRHMSFLEMAVSEGWKVSDDGYMVAARKGEDGSLQEQKFLFPYAHGEELPKPEDYILARSDVTLEAIYAAGEWEQIGTRMPAPDGIVDLNTNHTSTLLQPSKPAPNIPPAFADHPDAPSRLQGRVMNRKQRQAMEAKQRKAAKTQKRLVS